jgi:bla regulator protein BlaR1
MVASVKFLFPLSLLMTVGEWLRSLVATPILAKPGLAIVMEQMAQPFPQAQVFDATEHSAAAPHGNWLPVLLLTVWIWGALIIVLRWMRGWRRIRSAVRSALPLKIAADVPALCSTAMIEPGIFGISRPVLLLPEGIVRRLAPEQLKAIVAHEMCHVRRRDNLTFALHMIVEALFWFHPAVWWIGARLIDERERACDEAVLDAGSDAQDYAESILNVCKLYVESPLECASGVTGSDLKERIVRIVSRHAGLRLDFSRKLLLGAVGLITIAVPVVFGLAQATKEIPSWQVAAGKKLAFEVATIKPNVSDDPAKVNFTLGPGDTYAETGGRFRASNISLLDYVRFAYKLTDGQIQILQANAPKWIASTRFDIEAKSENPNPTKDQMRLMMQSLLAKRFKMVVHTETRELPVLAMVLVKPVKLGPQLRPHSADDGACSNVVASADHPSEPESPSAVPAVCGDLMSVGVPSAPSHVRIGGRKVPLTVLAAHLSEMGQFDRPVLDRTGLSGTFDFVLEWGPDPASVSATPEDHVDRQTYLEEALQDQLGLTLKRQKAPMDVLLIDHVDRQLTEN